MNANDFIQSIKTLDVESRIYLYKTFELYCKENQTELVDFEQVLSWMSVTDPNQIEAQTLSPLVISQLVNLGPKQVTAH